MAALHARMKMELCSVSAVFLNFLCWMVNALNRVEHITLEAMDSVSPALLLAHSAQAKESV